ncbi:hypothetical protein [[Clostridium] colinum]|nr:hypothetical protein [[Clostridium] colinum]
MLKKVNGKKDTVNWQPCMWCDESDTCADLSCVFCDGSKDDIIGN